MRIQGYVLENEDKINRAMNGSVGQKGQLNGGVGRFIPKTGKLSKEEQEAEAKREEEYKNYLLCEYDRLGGLITKDGLKVVTGSFYDFKHKRPREEFEVSFETIIEGKPVEVTEEEARVFESVKEKKEALKGKVKGKNQPKKKLKKKVSLKNLD